MRYVINDDETKSIKKVIRKFGKSDISKFNSKLSGSFTIINFRKYRYYDEVDLVFNGKLLGRSDTISSAKWYTSEVYKQDGFSKIKINKIIKQNIFQEVKNYCNYFGINLRWQSDIKKIKWI